MKNFSVDRSKYDDSVKVRSEYISKPGLSEELVRFISKDKNEPEWMLKKRLGGLKLFNKTAMPEFGPDLSELDFGKIIYYVKPGAKESKSWEDVPEEIRRVAEKIGIPEAEKKSLGGAGFQFESAMIYHNLKKDLEKKGVIFENMDTAVQKYPELVNKYFMTKCVPISDHKLIMLHAAVWSGGTFIYVPENVKVQIPLQAYFRMNEMKGGQFEHTLIIADKNSEISYIEGCSSPIYSESSLHAGCVEIYILEGARVRYSSIENWSKNVYNLNTKRAIVEKNGIIEWLGGNFGSCKTMLYPCSVLVGENAKSDYLGIAFAGKKQNQDTGSKVIHAAPNTSSTIRAKSISKDGGISSHRGFVRVNKNAENVKCSVNCDALLIDDKSIANTFPFIKVDSNKTNLVHEARVGKIGEEEVFYLMSRGLSEEQAIQMIVSGFIEPVVKKLPLEYAIELNKLIEIEMEGSVG